MNTRFLLPLFSLLLLVLLWGLGRAEEGELGLKVGANVPAFKATDQAGAQRTLKDLTGPNGLLLIFYRSASW